MEYINGLNFQAVRNYPTKTNPEAAQQLAEELFKAGEGKSGTSVEVFNKIFAHESYEQLKFIFEKYKAISGHTIEQALKKEISGDLQTAMLAIGNRKIYSFLLRVNFM